MKRNYRKIVSLALTTLSTSCLLTTYTTASAVAQEGLKIGTLVPTTGDLSSIGQNMPLAADLAVETINACGGVNGQPVTIVHEDSQTDPAAGASAMTKLAEVDRVAGVVGAFASSVSTAAVDTAVRNQIMLISPGSTSPVFTERAQNGDFNGFWARTAPPDTYQAQALAALVNQQGLTRVSTVVINNDYGVGFERQFVESFEGLGGTVVNRDNPVRYEPRATSLDTEAAAAFGGDAEGVAAVLYAETGSILLQSAFKQGLSENVTVFLTDGVFSPDFVEQVGKTADGKSIIAGSLGTVPGASGTGLDDFTALWQASTGKEVSAFVPHTWDATVLLMLAAEAAQSNTGEGIRDKIREVANAPGVEVSDPCEAIALIRDGQEINYQGASGNVDIDENGDVIGNYDVWRVNEDGTLEVIDTVAPAP
ncbi:MAG: amino acid ABC transporter substrate-binding protein [Gloeocapsa sp. DLM2.Bin57]|nr:MAG: amino acid ABC transporter substrate-binding protein [Gloeocapsa sp. DLM2.Bin57]